MTNEEQIKIEGIALLEELENYRYINITYLNELKNSLLDFDLDKISFCVKKIIINFREINEYYEQNNDYKNLLKFNDTITVIAYNRDKKANESVPLMRFFTALNMWLDGEGWESITIYKSKYIESYYDSGVLTFNTNLNLNNLYKSIYGKEYVEIKEQNITF